MHKILKKYYIAMLIFLLPSIFIIFSCTYRTNYSITSVGGVSKVDDRFEITDGYESTNLYSLYVYSSNNATLFQTWIADLYDIYDTSVLNDSYSHMNDAMWYKAGVIQKNQSEEASLINAYELASKTNSNISINYDYLGVIVSLTSADNNVFNLGDIITHVNNIKIESYDHYFSFERKIGTTITYLRDDKEYNITLKDGDDWASAYYDKFKINSSTPSYKLNTTLTTGPSAGMMQTLSIYNQLVSNDITMKDGVSRKIAGTGTIETNGSIGKIGGVAQKVYSAFYSGSDILLVPEGNYSDALKMYNKLPNKEKMILKSVSTFSEVLQWLS